MQVEREVGRKEGGKGERRERRRKTDMDGQRVERKE